MVFIWIELIYNEGGVKLIMTKMTPTQVCFCKRMRKGIWLWCVKAETVDVWHWLSMLTVCAKVVTVKIVEGVNCILAKQIVDVDSLHKLSTSIVFAEDTYVKISCDRRQLAHWGKMWFWHKMSPQFTMKTSKVFVFEGVPPSICFHLFVFLLKSPSL